MIAVVGFEGVTFLRPMSVRPMSVAKSPVFGGLDGVRAPRHGPPYSVGESSMSKTNDPELLVSVLKVFLDHRARTPWRRTPNLPHMRSRNLLCGFGSKIGFSSKNSMKKKFVHFAQTIFGKDR